jgi:hypothetical protein
MFSFDSLPLRSISKLNLAALLLLSLQLAHVPHPDVYLLEFDLSRTETPRKFLCLVTGLYR